MPRGAPCAPQRQVGSKPGRWTTTECTRYLPWSAIDSVRRELRMVRPATARCRGGGDSCRARVSLAGGASNKRVVVRLTDTDLRLVSVRPNRRSLRGAYGLFANRLRAGGSEYVFKLNAAQSIPRGSDLLLEFRAVGG